MDYSNLEAIVADTLRIFGHYGPAFAAMGAACAFIFGVVQFWLEYRHKVHVQEFEAYHRTLKDLVSPTDGGQVFQDRQAAAAFELRHFPRYYAVTVRIVEHLMSHWVQNEVKFVHDELGLTLEFIKKRTK